MLLPFSVFHLPFPPQFSSGRLKSAQVSSTSPAQVLPTQLLSISNVQPYRLCEPHVAPHSPIHGSSLRQRYSQPRWGEGVVIRRTSDDPIELFSAIDLFSPMPPTATSSTCYPRDQDVRQEEREWRVGKFFASPGLSSVVRGVRALALPPRAPARLALLMLSMAAPRPHLPTLLVEVATGSVPTLS